MGTAKVEFPPLLSEGFHPKTLTEVRALCVDDPKFSRSTTRADIMLRLERAIGRLEAAEVEGEVWIDGSFLTSKVDPEDVDLSLRIDGDYFDHATEYQQAVMNDLTELWDTEKIDGYLHFEWPDGHELYDLGQDNYNVWKKQWGMSRSGTPKGIVVVELNGSEP